MDRVSVILPTFNRGPLLEAAIASVLAQRHEDWELLVIDDASADDTAKRLARYRAESRIRVITNSVRRGAPHSRNVGLAQATGRFVNFLDSDDQLFGDKLDRQVARFRSDPTLDVVVAGCVRNRIEHGRTKPVLRIRPSRSLAHDFLTKRIKWAIHAPLWSRSYLMGQSGFDEELGSGQDYEYYARAVLRNPKVAYIDEPLAAINDHGTAVDPVKIRSGGPSLESLRDQVRSRAIVRSALRQAEVPAVERWRISLALDRHVLACIARAAPRVRSDAWRLLDWYVREGRSCRPVAPSPTGS